MGAAPRDRWFLGEGLKRTGPGPLERLVRLLLDETDPRGALVWHKGFGSWTRAEDVPLVVYGSLGLGVIAMALVGWLF